MKVGFYRTNALFGAMPLSTKPTDHCHQLNDTPLLIKANLYTFDMVIFYSLG
jgi:hypothetical protein